MNSITNLSPKALRKAADIKEKLDTLRDQLNGILGGEVSTPAQTTEAPKKRKMSAEGLANIRAGVAKRMAAKGGAKAVQKPKRKMTPAWRAALARAWEARRGKAKAGKAKL